MQIGYNELFQDISKQHNSLRYYVYKKGLYDYLVYMNLKNIGNLYPCFFLIYINCYFNELKLNYIK